MIRELKRDRLHVKQEAEQLRNERDTFKQKLDDAQVYNVYNSDIAFM